MERTLMEEVKQRVLELIAIGIVRPTGEYRDGEMVYMATPDDELSDEARAYLAYLRRPERDSQD